MKENCLNVFVNKLYICVRHATSEVHSSAGEFDTKLASQNEKFAFKLKSIETDV